MFPEKHVRVFPRKHVREFVKTRTCFGKQMMRILNAFGKMYNNYVENKLCIPF